MTHGKCCTPPTPTPRVAGTVPLTAAITMAKIKGIVYTALMAAWTRGGGLLAPRESAPACRKYHCPGHR